MVNSVNNQNPITTYPVKSFNKDFTVNNVNRDEETSIFKKEIHDSTKLGMIIGFISSIPFFIDNTGSAMPLVAKKIGIGLGMGLVTGLLSGIVQNFAQKSEKKEYYYTELSKGIAITGVCATIGSTFLTCTAGDEALFKWCKGKNLALKGGIIGAAFGMFMLESIIYDHLTGKDKKIKSIDTQA